MADPIRLHSLSVASALRESLWREKYRLSDLYSDATAGLTVGIISIPLAMALAIASGVPPQHGLYTAIIAGFIIALTGGSHLSVSGPTAAFVVVLAPVAAQFGVAGLAVSTLLAGILLVGMAVARFGRFIEYIPEPATRGFTAGIAILLAIHQIPELLGIQRVDFRADVFRVAQHLANVIIDLDVPTVIVSASSIAMMYYWPRWRIPFPPHLPVVIAGALLALVFQLFDIPVDTVASRFSYVLPDGSAGQGIPWALPQFVWPWQLPGPNGAPLDWSFATIQAIGPAVFSIAMLAAIESLLCAVVLDQMTQRRHFTNGEFLGQGLGNIV